MTARDAIRAVPTQRLLIETDAPYILPPPELIEFELPQDAAERELNHPANIRYDCKALQISAQYQSIASALRLKTTSILTSEEPSMLKAQVGVSTQANRRQYAR
jgi:Tat protein secretion system quality control protein TatD with DNase activity